MKVFQLHPTLECNQACTWCPYAALESVNEIPFPEIQHQLRSQRKTGCRILKISGGGEPTLYRDFHKLLRYANDLGYIVYLQTNGILLDGFIRRYVHDVRCSFGDGIPFTPPDIRPDGFSYVVSSNPEYDNLTELIKYALGHGVYVRVTQDDTNLDNIPSIEEIKESIPHELNIMRPGISETARLTGELQVNRKRGRLLKRRYYGIVRFWDALDFHSGENPCPCHDSPLFTPYGWFPCCKTHVAKSMTPGYNKTMVLGWEYPGTPYDGSKCSRCYY